MTFQQSYGFLFLKQPHIRQGSDGTLTEFCYCEEVAGLILSQRPLAPLLSAPPALLFAFAADNLERPLVFPCFASPPPSLPGGGSRGNNTNNRLRFSGRFFGSLQRGDCGFCASLRGRGKGCALQTCTVPTTGTAGLGDPDRVWNRRGRSSSACGPSPLLSAPLSAQFLRRVPPG